MYKCCALWIVWSFWASATGWILSSLHLLNGWGYLLAGLCGLVALFLLTKCVPGLQSRLLPTSPAPINHLLRHWKQRPLQLLFAVLAAAIFLGGALYIPWTFDATTYRLPRILYWWAHHGWFWTGSLDRRLDYSSTGFEWQMLPVLLLTSSDRFLFFLNWIPFLFMPALLLRFLRVFRVSRRLVVVLMWAIPSGYCYALQAGGIQVDGYSFCYLAAAFVYLDAWSKRGERIDLIFSLLAMALLTGAKTSNVFLALPYGVMFFSILYRRRTDLGVILAAALPCVLVSFIPIAALCYFHTGDIAGDPTNSSGFKAVDKPRVLAANLVMLVGDLLMPPISTPIKKELDRYDDWFNDTPFSNSLKQGHPLYHGLHHADFPYEGGAGIGGGIAFLLLIIALLHLPFVIRCRPYHDGIGALVAVTGWCAFLICFSLIAIDSMHRIAAPYYPLLIATLPWLWVRGPWDRSRLISGCGALLLASSILLVVTAPIRPVLPMLTILRYAADTRHMAFAEQTLPRYEFWTTLRDNLQEVREALPQNDDPIGFLGAYRETSYGLWKPLDGRKIFELQSPDPRDLERSKGVRLAVVTAQAIQQKFGIPLEDWLQKYNVQVKQSFDVNLNLSAKEKAPPSKYYIVTWQ